MNMRGGHIRVVPPGSSDKLIPDIEVKNFLLNLFEKYLSDSALLKTEALYKFSGFEIGRVTSKIPGAGRGVAVIRGAIPVGMVAALYPGTIYLPYEPVFIQSIGNSFIFRCANHIHVDGKDTGLSRLLYRSCYNRELMGTYQLCDNTWLTECPVNPLAIGQYVNNHNKSFPANVAYQEVDMDDIPIRLRQYIPNVHYSRNESDSPRPLRIIALIATRTIVVGEELFSSYFTFIQ